jgi:nitroimidazol reductase NimA-like FMN-containing flavoprotein (pyridoxamine 5'-phosphate oxidase superfamily)
MEYFKANNTVWGQALLDYGYSEGKCDHLFASVHFQGKVTIVEKMEEKQSAIECMIRQLDRNPSALIASLDVKKLDRTTIGRIDIVFMTGKKHKDVII